MHAGYSLLLSGMHVPCIYASMLIPCSHTQSPNQQLAFDSQVAQQSIHPCAVQLDDQDIPAVVTIWQMS